MDTENKEAKGRRHQIWGWILAIVGGGFTAVGIFILIVKIFFGDGTEWYLPVLYISIPCWVLGIPLLILGIRRIRNIGENEKINSEYNARKNKTNLIWGWIAMIVGGLISLLFLDTIFMDIIVENTDEYKGILACGVPGLLLGGTLLIVGIRRIKVVRGRLSMYSENTVGKEKKRRAWGWVFEIIGGLIVLISLGLLSFIYYVMFFLTVQKGIVELYKGFNAFTVVYIFILYILPLFLIGLSLIIPGYILLRKTKIRRQSQGWILIMAGGIYIIATILGMIYIIMNYSVLEEIGVAFSIWSPIFILGILGIVFGIRDVRHKEKTLPENPSGLDNPQNDVIGGEGGI